MLTLSEKAGQLTSLYFAGNGIDYEDYSIEETLVSNRQCENISLIDDTEIEDTEQFILNGSFLVPSGNITFDPSLAVVFIEDNDAIATTTGMYWNALCTTSSNSTRGIDKCFCGSSTIAPVTYRHHPKSGFHLGGGGQTDPPPPPPPPKILPL